MNGRKKRFCHIKISTTYLLGSVEGKAGNGWSCRFLFDLFCPKELSFFKWIFVFSGIGGGAPPFGLTREAKSSDFFPAVKMIFELTEIFD